LRPASGSLAWLFRGVDSLSPIIVSLRENGFPCREKASRENGTQNCQDNYGDHDGVTLKCVD
jgi:hypothetical protein